MGDQARFSHLQLREAVETAHLALGQEALYPLAQEVMAVMAVMAGEG